MVISSFTHYCLKKIAYFVLLTSHYTDNNKYWSNIVDYITYNVYSIFSNNYSFYIIKYITCKTVRIAYTIINPLMFILNRNTIDLVFLKIN